MVSDEDDWEPGNLPFQKSRVSHSFVRDALKQFCSQASPGDPESLHTDKPLSTHLFYFSGQRTMRR